MKHVFCPVCGKKVYMYGRKIFRPYKNVKPVFVICSHCITVFEYSPEKKSEPERFSKDKTSRKSSPLFACLFRQDKAISSKWFHPAAYFFLVFSVIWNGLCLLIIYYEPFTLNSLAYIFVGIWLVYYTLCLFFNNTTITLGKEGIYLRHTPFPWGGEANLSKEDITSLFTREKVQKGSKGKKIITYELYAGLANKREKRLAFNMKKQEDALYVKKLIEKHLRKSKLPLYGNYIRLI